MKEICGINIWVVRAIVYINFIVIFGINGVDAGLLINHAIGQRATTQAQANE